MINIVLMLELFSVFKLQSAISIINVINEEVISNIA